MCKLLVFNRKVVGLTPVGSTRIVLFFPSMPVSLIEKNNIVFHFNHQA